MEPVLQPRHPVHLALVLHAHLPFVRHPEHPEFHEESWLFEAILESYLPLLGVLEGWARDGIPGRLTLSVSPTLGTMLGDPLLRDRFGRHLRRVSELAEQEEIRAHLEPTRRRAIRSHREWLHAQARVWDRWEGQVLRGFAAAAGWGQIELITCSATHALLPLLRRQPDRLRRQLHTAAEFHESWTGHRSRGVWLPECAWHPDLDPHLVEAGFQWSIVESHGLLRADPRPRQGLLAPVLTPAGLAVFGRDPASARQVWSREGGYPGDVRYREFHRDVADEAEWDYIRPYLHGAGSRSPTGIKIHRVTGSGLDKELYDSEAAQATTREHARHFVEERLRVGAEVGNRMPRPPVILAPYDAELFGHWWFEGPVFLDAVAREIHRLGGTVERVSPSEHLERFPWLERSMPAESTWGEGGHLSVWLDEATNAWIQPRLTRASRRLDVLLQRRHGTRATEAVRRLRRQAERELLLAEASDWPFLMQRGTAGDYPRRRVESHLDRLEAILQLLETTPSPEAPAWLDDLESRHNLVPGAGPKD